MSATARVLRGLAVALAGAVAFGAAGAVPRVAGASFTAVSRNPANAVATLSVEAPASLEARGESGGAVALTWPAAPTAAGAGHLITYLVFRGPLGGPYTQVASTGALTYRDTPDSDGTYAYVLQTQVGGGGAFQSGNSAAASAVSDRTPPTAVTGLRSTSGTKKGDVTINLAWTPGTDALSGVQGYEVRWSNVVTAASCPAPDAASYPNAVMVGTVSAASLPLGGGQLVSGRKYCAYLVTIDGVGNRSAASTTAGPTTAQ